MTNNNIGVVSIDDLAISSDQDLFDHNNQLLNELVRHSNHSNKRQQIEIELCYLQREMQIRSQRQTAHSDYLNNLRDNTYEDESRYPLMDEYVNYPYVLLSKLLTRKN